MEKQQQERRSGGEKDGGRSSRNSGGTGPKQEEHRIDIAEVSCRVKNWIESVKIAKDHQTDTRSQTEWPSMPKVPETKMKKTQDSEKFYEPKVISFGPYHHDKPHLLAGETIKPLCAQKFVADSNQDIEDLYKKIESNIEAVRRCYDSSATNKYDDEKLAWMMLLDGCFILQFIRSCTDDMSNINLKDHQISFVERDLFLLENQLPFGVLRLIFEGSSKFKHGSTMKDMINRFVTDRNGIQPPPEDDRRLPQLPDEPYHLLQLMRSALLGGKDKIPTKIRKPNRQRNRQSFLRIMELKEKGIYLKPSGTNSLTDISFEFHHLFGCLNLPPITIDDSTQTRWLNILAYEMCSEDPDYYAVTSYIRFLDSLIGHPDDVKELRSKRILCNRLGSDEEVAQTFKQISHGMLVDSESYEGVRLSIQEHYEKLVNVWLGECTQWYHNLFRTPERVMAAAVTLITLYLALIQTYYTMYPRK